MDEFFPDAGKSAVIKIIEPVIHDCRLELYDVRLHSHNGQHCLQVFVNSDDGVNLDACETISKRISLLLDLENIFEFPYTLEVSSPGIFRTLRTEKDRKRNIGKRVRVKYVETESAETVNGSIVGILTEVTDATVCVLNEKTNQRKKINKANLDNVSLAPKL